MQFRPRFNETVLASGQCASDQLDRVNTVDGDGILIVSVKMWPMMRRAGFNIHPNDDPEKTRNFWHYLIIPLWTSHYLICDSSASAWGSQNIMSMARYSSIAADSSVLACSRRPIFR
jgi:hypothetical protein